MFFMGRANNNDNRLLVITIRYGERMRAWKDVGFSIESEH